MNTLDICNLTQWFSTHLDLSELWWRAIVYNNRSVWHQTRVVRFNDVIVCNCFLKNCNEWIFIQSDLFRTVGRNNGQYVARFMSWVNFLWGNFFVLFWSIVLCHSNGSEVSADFASFASFLRWHPSGVAVLLKFAKPLWLLFHHDADQAFVTFDCREFVVSCELLQVV